MTKEIIVRQPSGEKIVLDKIFSSEELEYLQYQSALVGGCPGHEYLEEELQRPNWPPKKEPFSSLREFISNLRFG